MTTGQDIIEDMLVELGRFLAAYGGLAPGTRLELVTRLEIIKNHRMAGRLTQAEIWGWLGDAQSVLPDEAMETVVDALGAALPPGWHVAFAGGRLTLRIDE